MGLSKVSQLVERRVDVRSEELHVVVFSWVVARKDLNSTGRL